MGVCSSDLNKHIPSNTMPAVSGTIGAYQATQKPQNAYPGAHSQSAYPAQAATQQQPSYLHSAPQGYRTGSKAPDRGFDESDHTPVAARNYNSDAHQRQREAMLAATQARMQAQKSKSTRTHKYSSKLSTTESKEQTSEPASPIIQDGIKAPTARRPAGSLERENPEWFGASAVTTRE